MDVMWFVYSFIFLISCLSPLPLLHGFKKDAMYEVKKITFWSSSCLHKVASMRLMLNQCFTNQCIQRLQLIRKRLFFLCIFFTLFLYGKNTFAKNLLCDVGTLIEIVVLMMFIKISFKKFLWSFPLKLAPCKQTVMFSLQNNKVTGNKWLGSRQPLRNADGALLLGGAESLTNMLSQRLGNLKYVN